MKNITLSADEHLLEAAHKYAAVENTVASRSDSARANRLEQPKICLPDVFAEMVLKRAEH